MKKLNPDEWDIVVLREAITGKGGMNIVDKKTSESRALNRLESIRDNYFGHVRRGMDQNTYEKLVKESQEQYQILLGTDEQQSIDEITSSKG